MNYKILDDFKNSIRNNPKMIYELKYDLNNKINKNDEFMSLWENEEKAKEDVIEKQIQEELGFTNYIKYLSSKSIPIIGHNIYFDLMFIYDKFISDLPSDFYSFKSSLHKYFPIIYDTKYISSCETTYESKTNLEILHKTIAKKKYDMYVKFEQDIENGFCKEMNDLHDAGYDSKITGECFVLMNKALENNYVVNNPEIDKKNNKKKKKPKFEEDSISENNNINNSIKYGFCRLELFDKYQNIAQMSLVEVDYGKIILDINKQSKEEYLKNENYLINNIFRNVYVIKIKTNLNQENKFLLNNYEIANLFKNDELNMNVIKIDYDKFFIEFSDEANDKIKNLDNKDEIRQLIEEVKNKKDNNKLIIDEVYDYNSYINKFDDFLC